MRISHSLLTLSIALAPFSASAAAYIKFDGVDGEVKAPSSSSTSSAAARGNVEYEWKVEEGESAEPGSDDLPLRATTSSSSSQAGGTKDHKEWIDVNSATDDEEPTRDIAPPRASSSSSVSSPSAVRAPDDSQEGNVDYFLEIDGVEGESSDEEGSDDEEEEEAPAPGVEPDEIDVAADGEEPLMTNFGILLGGDTGEDEEEGEENPAATIIEEILMEGMEEQGAPAEQISLNFEKIKVSSKQKVKFLGFIPVDVTADVEIDAENNVKVKYPWWTFIASGKDRDALGKKIFTALSNVSKAKHDAMMNAVRNMK